MKYRLAVFDMDGTILYTLQDIVDSTNHILRSFGMPEKTLEQMRSYIGNGIMREIECSVPEGTSAEVIRQVHDAFLPYYGEHCNDTTRPYDGILSLMQDLRSAGMKTAVVSNKGDFAVQELIRRYFSEVCDMGLGEKEGIRRKPDPDMTDAVLEFFGISRDEAVYIGDSEVDIETARNSGLDCICVTWGYRDEDFLIAKGAELIAHTPQELKQILLG
ncbi:MAG: HAD family hydrolase [Erysipelotrichaceae bacterium]|nr:HAD family hydrolase [Erysipelotrichaceae bacterium]